MDLVCDELLKLSDSARRFELDSTTGLDFGLDFGPDYWTQLRYSTIRFEH